MSPIASPSLSQAAESRRRKLAAIGLPLGEMIAVRSLFGIAIAFGLVTSEAQHLSGLKAPIVTLQGEGPEPFSIAGIALVEASGLSTIYREPVLRAEPGRGSVLPESGARP